VRALAGAAALAALVAPPVAPAAAPTVGYDHFQVAGASVSKPTSLDFGPDGRVYVAQQNGVIKALAVTRTGKGAYSVTSTETISDLVSGPNALPNHNDDGTLNTAVKNRLVTGLLVEGTAASPIIYVTSSDPRIGAGVGSGAKGDLNLDTNSGVVTRFTKAPTGGWTMHHLVRGLPRSEENHTANGMALSADGTKLYIAQGGNTNNGAPSSGFAGLPEYALSAAILRVDLNEIPVGTTHDLPTLGRPAGATPFGGNDGLTQAMADGVVQVHAPGFRNAYDIIRTQGGKLFTIDNGANGGWGDVPVGEGPAGTCTNDFRTEPGSSNPDELYEVTAAATYGGHPNPTRASTANTFGGKAAVSAGNAVECDFRVGAAAGALASFPTSTNGLTEYTASAFAGQMKGDLLAVDYHNALWRIELNGSGAATTTKLLTSAVADRALDVAVPGPGALDGTIWMTDYGNWTPAAQGGNPGGLWVVEPADLDGGVAPVCTPSNPNEDSDKDGYTNGDEQAAGTNPCAPGDVPRDFDKDQWSDRTDPDDDNDGLADVVDAFARDASNGITTTMPKALTFENEGEGGGGGDALSVGFTGLMTNGVTNYLDQFDPAKMTVGGAAGLLTVDEADEGDALVDNRQNYAFQLGVKPGAGVFTVHGTIVEPLAKGPKDNQSLGVFLGAGDQDNYLKIVAASNCGTVVQAVKEVSGVAAQSRAALTLPAGALELYLRVDPNAGTVQPSFARTPGGARVNVGGLVAVPKAWFTSPTKGLAVGIISTSTGPAPAFPASWDRLAVTPGEPAGGVVSPSQAAPVCQQPGASPTPAPTAGSGSPSRPRPVPDRTAPRLTDVTLSRTRVRTSGRSRGTTLRFRLSEAARVRVSLARATTGRRVGGSCRRTTSANRRARPCIRYVTAGRLSKAMPKGTGRLTITGRLAGRRLAPGRYRMTITATDAAGNRSTAVRRQVRIVR
jgi:hypothetical protein